MQSSLADAYWAQIEEAEEVDRIPVPFMGFLSGMVISLALWGAISWVAFSLFA
ncbi:MAG: hypothetical protein HY699_03240 [Deltaproteobacteria bacterium]|nr:hypothetical protein [Deltaproteobacteria bacterium]